MEYTNSACLSCDLGDMPRPSGELSGWEAILASEEPPSKGAPAEPAAHDQPDATAAAAAAAAKRLARTSVTRGRNICIAVGDDCCTEKVLKFAAKYICKKQDMVTLVHVSKPGGSKAAASGAAGATDRKGASSSKDEAAGRGAQLLEKAKQTLLRTGKVALDRISVADVPARKNVGSSLVAHCQHGGYHILVIGSRGMSGMKARLGSMMGEGSVSKYCADNLDRVAVVVVKPPLGHDWAKS